MGFTFAKPMPIYCPVCYRVTVEKNFNALVEIQKFKYDALIKDMPNSILKMQIIGQLKVINDPKHIRDIMKDRGYMILFCESCLANITQEQYEQRGLHVVRIKNFVFEEKWFDTHKEDVYKLLKIPIEAIKK